MGPSLFAPGAGGSLSRSGAPGGEPPQKFRRLEAQPVRAAPERLNWVDSHAPKGLGELVGNPGVVKKLAEWLRDWDSVVLGGNAKKLAFRGGGAPENINARAVLVSGPPGIGKTTSCRLVAQMHGGYEVLEYNASDARSQRIIREMAEGIADNTALNFGAGKAGGRVTRRACIIMDEVDGMGAGDRGGNAALIKMIKGTRNPIICICNDQSSQKIRSLASSCYDLKFTRPPKQALSQRCVEIARKEGFDIEVGVLESLAESCGSDMRMLLNQMQILARSAPATSRSVDLKQRISQMTKDQEVMMGPFDACKKLLSSMEAAKATLTERLDMFFVDFSLVSLLVQENYLRSVEKRPADLEVLNRCAYSADLMTVGDIINDRINCTQDWSLLPDMGVVSTTYPAFVTNGFLGFPSFPSFLGKYSTMSKTRRLNQELEAHLRLSATTQARTLVSSGYTELLYKRLVGPLLRGSPEAARETVGLLDTYGLQKEHLVEHLTELRQHLAQEDLFKAVDPRVKAAMTRELNSGGHAPKVLLPPGGKKRRLGGDGFFSGATGPDGEVDAEPEAEVDAEEAANSDGEGDVATSALIKVKAKAKAKAKAQARGSGSGVGESPSPAAPKATPKAKSSGRSRAKAKAAP